MNYLSANESFKEITSELGIELYNGDNSYDNFLYLTESNYTDIFNTHIHLNIWAMEEEYFQTKEITNLIYDHLHKEEYKTRIIERNQFKERYNNNNDCFIHIRLGDIKKANPGFEYYDKALQQIETIGNIYIGTDSPEDEIVQSIKQKYCNVHVISYNELQTIQFATTNKHVILSHGTFSAVIGYLSFYSTVYYPAYSLAKVSWCGDTHSIPGWIEIGGGGL
jgi:hypothetical protein